MIIVEVDRHFERFEAVLGRHSWSEFLLAPTEEEAGRSSEVFFCTYNTNEAVRCGGRLLRLALMVAILLIITVDDRLESRKHPGVLVSRMASQK